MPTYNTAAALVWLQLLVFGCVLASNSKVDVRSLLTDKRHVWSANTTFTFPEDKTFEAVTQRWTIYKPPTFEAVVRPATETDVVQCVRIATEANLPFLATGARHGYSTSHGTLQNGLEIDLSHFDSIDIGRNHGTMTIGGATQFNDILDPVFAAGYEIPTGSCSCTGMVGATNGAGVGRFNGIDGMIIDFLVSVRLVTASGEIVEASETENPELFWGLRGAGANFGIITSATYKLVPLRNNGEVTNVDIILPPEMVAEYFETLERYNASMPAELAGVSIINYNPDTAAAQILANWVYYGSEADCRKALAPILALNPPVVSFNVVPWNKLLATVGFGIDPMLCIKDIIRNIHSANVRNFSAATWIATFEKMSKFYTEYPTARLSVIQMETFPNQAAFAVPDENTAYPWRDATGNMIFIFAYTNATTQLAEAANNMGREIRSDFVATSGYQDLAVYVNYAYGDESLEQIYGERKLPRLAALKAKWDPENVFAYNNPLPTTYSGKDESASCSRGRDEL
ncbi:hypothetical protein F4802DRAFT_592432 [Xylaria palmicola]|nr:hypothetical protein F4802DRAFT_592432 [Xylaria palmicola]